MSMRGRKPKPGRILFVGSGPGDPGLLTTRARAVMTASLAADYRFPMAGAQGWVGGTLGYVGDRRSNFSQQPNVLDVPAYTTVGLNAGADINRVRVTLYVKNLTDERGINFINSVGFPLNPYTAGVIQPRTLGIDLAYRF